MGRGGFGSRTAADPSGDPPKVPKKQTVGTVTASHKVLTLQALSSSLNADTAKRGFLGQERLWGDLRQSVPRNGRVHLLGVEVSVATPAEPRGEKKKLCKFLGGEKLLKFVKKCR